jgi:deoxyribodipyrimidine photolyase-related protein
MTIGIWVLGDQLFANQAALQSRADDRAATPVILIESVQFSAAIPYHLQKVVLIWSAMRHFAAELQQAGWSVTYAKTAEDFQQPLLDWIRANQITELRLMQPHDRPFQRLIQSLNLPCTVTFLPQNHFIWSDAEFGDWAKSRKRWLMEDFYRAGRQRFNILMVGDQPAGGRWNFDKENRKPPKSGLKSPEPLWFEPDPLTQEIIDWLKQSDRFQIQRQYWQVEPFRWGVTRSQALQALNAFIESRLAGFGPYQDAMVIGEFTLWHALLSPYLNLGLLQPLEVVQAAEAAYLTDRNPATLSSIEGFIRQVMGWREYMHGVYVQTPEDYPTRNWFQHDQPLPDFFWTGNTQMNCLHHAIAQVQSTGYAHHIQRLMVLNNFALIAGIAPQAIEHWFHAAFIDAYDWVMQTNVIGMGQFADGGLLASKPYAASANYINKMSNYCRTCCYDPRDRSGDNACPFNVLYWDFLDRHQAKLKAHGRMNLMVNHLSKLPPEEMQRIRQLAETWRGKASTPQP